MKKSGEINYRKNLFRFLMLMSSSALLVTTGVHASTMSVADMDSDIGKSMHHETMGAFSDDDSDNKDDGTSDDEGCCDTRDSSGDHKFSPFSSENTYGQEQTGHEWIPGTMIHGSHSDHNHGSHGDHDHDGHGDNDHVPFDSDPPGFEHNGHEWRHHHDDAVVPVPAAVWLFGSGLMGLIAVARRADPIGKNEIQKL